MNDVEKETALVRAMDIARAVVIEGCLPPTNQVNTEGATETEILAHALIVLTERLEQLTSAPTQIACYWCWQAEVNKGRDADDAWEHAPRMTKDTLEVHTLSCDNNPLVLKLRARDAMACVMCRERPQ